MGRDFLSLLFQRIWGNAYFSTNSWQNIREVKIMHELAKVTITEKQKSEFANSLKELREAHLITLEKLSELTEIPNQTISRYERGENEPSVFQAYKLAKCFGVTVEEMIDGDI